jgi:uroporphyrinogen-III synthase
MKMLILRPIVGAEATAARATALGHHPVVAPLFHYRPLDWTPPAARPQALLMTSAAAARLGGPGLAAYHALPLQAVGLATAAAARAAGFVRVSAGTGDARAALAALAGQGITEILHLAGRDHVALPDLPVRITRIPVYAADAIEALPAEAFAALDGDAVVLLHSPRAARVFADRIAAAGRMKAMIRIACFSAAVADAAGTGWAGVAIAPRPADDALFAAAAMLCDQDATNSGSRNDDRAG